MRTIRIIELTSYADKFDNFNCLQSASPAYKMFRSIAVAVLAVAAVSAHDRSSRLTKPPLENSLDYLEHGLEQYLKETKYTATKWNNGYIPQQ